MKIINIIKKDIVLCVSLSLALISMFFVTPDKKYVDYIDFDTLFLLFALMAVMAGYRKQGLFSLGGYALLKKVKSMRQLVCVLVFLPFFFSMVITNDVALITFVPLCISVLNMADLRENVVFVIVLQTLAANLGSMLTPMGNPQNLYLYGQSGMTLMEFIAVTLPFTAVAALCLILSVFICKNSKINMKISKPVLAENYKKLLPVYTVLFILCILCVAKLIPAIAVAAVVLTVVLTVDRSSLKIVDYSLLGTFIGFFIFIGNMSRISWFRDFLEGIIDGHEIIVTELSSQIISNVPSALLLSGFTTDYTGLIIGSNIGGLGTMIASMASLISYRQLAKAYPDKRKKYFILFTLANVLLLIVLNVSAYCFKLV